MKKTKTIHCVLTGGTIDSYYDSIKDTAVPYKKSIIPVFIRSLKLYKKFKFSEICMKDSRQITDQDRKRILQTLEKSPHSKFIITHGTYTMPQTARYLKAHLQRKDSCVKKIHVSS